MGFNIGSFVSGGVNGFKAGLDLKDIVNKAKENKGEVDIVGEQRALLKSHDNTFKVDATVPTEANANGMIKARDLGNSAKNTDGSNAILPGETAGNPDTKPGLGDRLSTAASLISSKQPAAVQNEAPIYTAPADVEVNPNLLRDTKFADGGRVHAKFKMPMYADGDRVDASSLGLDAAAGQTPRVPPTEPLQQAPQSDPRMQPAAQIAPNFNQQQQATEPTTPTTQGLDAVPAQSKAPQVPTPRQREAYYSRAAIDKNMYDKLTDNAVKYGNGKAALQYFKASFDTSRNMIKDNLKYAQREFEQFGDLSSFKDLYNHAYPDGRQVSDIQKDDKGQYVITSQGRDNKPLTQTYSTDQVKSLLMNFDDTEGLWKAQAATAAERQKLDEASTRKVKEEKSKGVTLASGAKHFNSDGTTYDNPKADGGLGDEIDIMKAAENPKDPNYELANKMLARKKKEKIDTAVAGRAPKEVRLDERAAQAWLAANKGKTLDDYMTHAANRKESDNELETQKVTEKPVFDAMGVPVMEVGADGKPTNKQMIERSVTKNEKIPAPVKEQSTDYKAYMERYNKFKGNPAAQKKLTDIARSKGIVK